MGRSVRLLLIGCAVVGAIAAAVLAAILAAPIAAARATSPARSATTTTTLSAASTTQGSSPVNGTPGKGGLGAKVVPAPSGFSLSPDVYNGPISRADFNQYWGDPASLHFARGYDVTYDSNDLSASIEVTLFQFATPADAANFRAGFILGDPGTMNSRADPVIPRGDDYDSTSPDQGFYDHGVIATKGSRAFVIDDLTGSAAPVPLVETMARQQYAALSAPGRATALPAPGRATALPAPGGATALPAPGGATALPAPGGASAQTGAESITSYDARIAIQGDGSILVTEQIAYDFGNNERHGIIREIPVRVRYNGSYDRIYSIHVRSVQSPDAPDQYTVDNNGSYVGIKIGDPYQTVTGVNRYIISYLVRGALNGFADHDELYWNAVGDQWDVPIGRVTVRVSAPAAVTRAACFAGPLGSTGSCQQAGIAAGVAHFIQAGLGAHEGLTVVVAIPKGVVAVPRPVLVQRWSLQRAFAVTPVSAGVAGGLLAVFAILGAVVLVRRRDGRNPGSAAHGAAPLSGHGQPAMKSAPPKDVRPGQAGTLLDGVANPRDATGTIVDLAVRGYLRIEGGLTVLEGLAIREKPDWQLVRLGKTGGLLDYEQILLDGLFEDYPSTQDGAPSTLLSELGPAFARSLKRAQDALYRDVASRGWFTARPDQVRRRWLMTGCVLFAAGAVAIIVAAARSHLALIPVPVALAGLVLIGGARWMPARTAKGTELARRLLGFRRYLTTAPAGQARPAGQAGLLDDYLPYAIVFGCTEQWAAVTEAVADAGQEPSWYRSSEPYQPGSLSTLSQSGHYFSSMHHFATTTNSWIAHGASILRSGSSGSGSSGSGSSGSGSSGSGFSGGGGGSGFSGGGGGGGSSGGGGGGGGGGSW
jgi:uncharacterized membrane protein YgcG